MRHIVEKSINSTLKLCKSGDILFIPNGVYNEKIHININDLAVEGESIDGVVIKNNDYYHKIMNDYNECNTFRTYTFAVTSDNVTIKNLTIENDSVPSSIYGQAVALHASGNNLLCENIKLKGAQDTLFTGPLPLDLIKRYQNFLEPEFLSDRECKQIYRNCTIIGDVDFIFGCAVALFENCTIISIDKGSYNPGGYICAPAHYSNSTFGYLFYNCRITCEKNVKNVFLARPWRDDAKAAFIDCTYDNHINEEGFSNWQGTERNKTAKFYEYNLKESLSNRIKWSIIFREEKKNQYLNDFLKYMSLR